MSKIFKNLLIYAICFLIFVTLVPSTFASTLNLSPVSTTIPQGSTVSVQVRLNTQGESINGVSAYLSYPTDKLEVTRISYGSKFDFAWEGSYGGGSIKISRSNVAGVVGNVTIATIGFRGKSLGTATVAFVGGSAAPRTSDSSDSLNLGGSTGGTYKIGPPQKITPGDKIPPVIKDVEVSEISTNSATVTWITDKESDSTLEYGLQEDKYILQIYDKELVKEHKIVIKNDLIPGETFHFRVKSKGKPSADGENEGVSNNLTFKLKGYIVKIKLVDSNNNALADTEVTLYSEPIKGITDQNGEVIFTDVSPGRHLFVVKHKNNTETTKEIEVEEGPIPTELTLTVEAPLEEGNNYLTILYVSLGVLVAITCVGILILRRKKLNPPPPPTSPTTTTIPN